MGSNSELTPSETVETFEDDESEVGSLSCHTGAFPPVPFPRAIVYFLYHGMKVKESVLGNLLDSLEDLLKKRETAVNRVYLR